ncbi:MAG: tyrosine-type recombinase/integrase, partial [Pseudomonadota bacterium]|nr:tyrosine-type recombinase/integrase [Pseudomonadota bacterium]
EARKKADIRRVQRGEPPNRKTRGTYADAVEAYLDTGKYLKGIQESGNYFGAWDCNDITSDDVMAWAMKQYGGKASRVNRNGIAVVRAVLNEAARKQWCGRFTMQMLPEKRKKRKAVDEAWTEAMCNTMRSRPKFFGLAELLLLGQLTGLRVDELTQMRWDKVDWEAMECVIPKSKVSKGQDVVVTLPEDLVPALRRLELDQTAMADPKAKIEGLHHHTKARLRSGFCFGYASKYTVWHHWREVAELAKVEYVSPHQAMRHTFATFLHNVLGWSAIDIAEAGRWSSVRLVEETYVHSDKTTRKAAKEIAKARVANARIGSLRIVS